MVSVANEFDEAFDSVLISGIGGWHRSHGWVGIAGGWKSGCWRMGMHGGVGTGSGHGWSRSRNRVHGSDVGAEAGWVFHSRGHSDRRWRSCCRDPNGGWGSHGGLIRDDILSVESRGHGCYIFGADRITHGLPFFIAQLRQSTMSIHFVIPVRVHEPVLTHGG